MVITIFGRAKKSSENSNRQRALHRSRPKVVFCTRLDWRGHRNESNATQLGRIFSLKVTIIFSPIEMAGAIASSVLEIAMR
jgi:hypothetical protein